MSEPPAGYGRSHGDHYAHQHHQQQQGNVLLSRHGNDSALLSTSSSTLSKSISGQLGSIHLSRKGSESSLGPTQHHHQQQSAPSHHGSSKACEHQQWEDVLLEGCRDLDQEASGADLLCSSRNQHYHQQQRHSSGHMPEAGLSNAKWRSSNVEQGQGVEGTYREGFRSSLGGDGRVQQQEQRQQHLGACPTQGRRACSNSSGGPDAYAATQRADSTADSGQKQGLHIRIVSDTQDPGPPSYLACSGRRSSLPSYVLRAPYATSEDDGGSLSPASAAAAGIGKGALSGLGRRSVTAGGYLGSEALTHNTARWSEAAGLTTGHLTDRGLRGHGKTQEWAGRDRGTDCDGAAAAVLSQQQGRRRQQAYLLPTDAMAECLEGRFVPVTGSLKGLYEAPSHPGAATATAAAGESGSKLGDWNHQQQQQQRVRDKAPGPPLGANKGSLDLPWQQHDSLIERSSEPGLGRAVTAAAAGEGRKGSSTGGMQGGGRGSVGHGLGTRRILASETMLGSPPVSKVGASGYDSPGSAQRSGSGAASCMKMQ